MNPKSVSESKEYLLTKLDELKIASDAAGQEDMFHDAAEKVQTRASSLAQRLDTHEALADAGLASKRPQWTKRVRKHLARLQDRLNDNPLNFKGGGQNAPYDNLLKGSVELTKELRTIDEQSWRLWLAELPAPDEGWLDGMQSLPGLTDVVDRVRTGITHLKGLEKPPDDAAALDARLEKLKEVQAGLTTVEEKAEAFPNDVKDFFAAARLNRARLRHLTPEVLEWLDAQDLSKNVRVSFVTSS